MTNVINARATLGMLANEVHRRGFNYRYLDHHDLCTYTEHAEPMDEAGAEPGCIVGGVLMALGLNMSNPDGFGIEGSFPSACEDFEAVNPGTRFTLRSRFLLSLAQRTQDNGGTHGEALTAAQHANYLLEYVFCGAIADEVGPLPHEVEDDE